MFRSTLIIFRGHGREVFCVLRKNIHFSKTLRFDFIPFQWLWRVDLFIQTLRAFRRAALCGLLIEPRPLLSGKFRIPRGYLLTLIHEREVAW